MARISRQQAMNGRAPGRAWLALAAGAALAGCGGGDGLVAGDAPAEASASTIDQGRQIFRHDTFGDETFWSDTLRMHEVIAKAVDPKTALSVGLKVDAEALPAEVVKGIQDGSISLTDPATTIALLKLGAVVGLEGTVESIDGKDTLTRVGVTCALCHSTVDDSFAAGIGKRLDGWPNRDLDPGRIISLSPALKPAQKAVYASWGKGKYDPRYNFDGRNGPQVIPPAYGLAGIHRITVTGDGPLVVREKSHPASPMTLDQALYEMELVGHDFYLFVDKDSERPAVVYRRKGYDYGVISLDVVS